MEKKKEMDLIESFEFAKDRAELKALSDLSLKQPLTKEQYSKMIKLANLLNIGGKEWNI